MSKVIDMSALQGEAIRAEQLGKTYAEGKLRTPVFDGLDLREPRFRLGHGLGGQVLDIPLCRTRVLRLIRLRIERRDARHLGGPEGGRGGLLVSGTREPEHHLAVRGRHGLHELAHVDLVVSANVYGELALGPEYGVDHTPGLSLGSDYDHRLPRNLRDQNLIGCRMASPTSHMNM